MSRFLQFVLFLVLILALFPLYTHFKVQAAPIPPGVYLAGLDMSEVKDPNEIRQHIDRIYQQPIDVRFGDARLVLQPAAVDFTVDVDQMVSEAGQYLEGTEFLDIAVREALGFEQRRRDIPVRFMLNNEKLRTWLAQVAAEQNHAASPARLLTPSPRWTEGSTTGTALPPGYVGVASRDWSWIEGKPGQTLDLEASIPLVIQALTAGDERIVRLALQETPAPLPTMEDLAREINAYLLNFPGFGAAYVQDLNTGEEALVDADISFSGMSTLKIGIVSAIMQKLPNGIALNDEESDLVGQWIDYALGESNNHAANQLLGFLGDGSVDVGTARFTAFMHELGMTSTYMQSGYDAQVQLAQISTPGNQSGQWNTNPDSNLQTTTAEMGRTLAAIYECSQGGGLFIETFGDTITPDECQAILFYMTHDEFQELVWAGLPRPERAWVVHKHGFAFESHSDVALVWGPTGPYVISIFLYREGWMDWQNSNGAMKTISRITWNFFDFQRQRLGLTTPGPFILVPPPGYSELHPYIKVASTGYR